VKKYRKKRVVIEALQLKWENWEDMCSFVGVGELVNNKPQGKMLKGNKLSMDIPTIEGVMTAHEGDYIICGTKGEFYPCREDIFKEIYDEVDDEL